MKLVRMWMEQLGGHKTPDDVIIETGDEIKIDNSFGVIRWANYVKKRQVARVQNTLQHIVSTSVVIQPTITVPFSNTHRRLDQITLKHAIDQHDIAEIECFDRGVNHDRSYQTKQVSDALDEHEMFKKIHARAPSRVYEKLYRAYLLQDASKDLMELSAEKKQFFVDNAPDYSFEVLLFEMIERVGYLVYAFEQLKCGYKQIAVDTLNFQGPHLDKLANQEPVFADLMWSSKNQPSLC